MCFEQNFKEPCEKINENGERILDPREVKTIFNTILPIYALHRSLLRDLVQLLFPWSEENLIGKVYYDHVSIFTLTFFIKLDFDKHSLNQGGGFERAYKRYVISYEISKEEIIRCKQEKPAFESFLKIAERM